MTMRFSELRSPQIQIAADAGTALVLPLGQTEEHGPHLPVNTDSLIVERVCAEAVRRLDGTPAALLLDTVVYGYSQRALKAWPGTFIIPQPLLTEMLRHLVACIAEMGFRKLVIVSGHGNYDGLARVVAREAADVCGIGPGVLFPHAFLSEMIKNESKAGPRGSCHACEMETSLMLHLAPELVDMKAAVAHDKLTFTSPYSSNQAFVSTWTVQTSRSGSYGDPTVATAEFGKRLFEKMVDETAKFIRYYHGMKQV